MRIFAVFLLGLGAAMFGTILDRLVITNPGGWFLLFWLVVSTIGKIEIARGAPFRNVATLFSVLLFLVMVSASMTQAFVTGFKHASPHVGLSPFDWIHVVIWGLWAVYDFAAIMDSTK